MLFSRKFRSRQKSNEDVLKKLQVQHGQDEVEVGMPLHRQELIPRDILG